VTFLDSLRCAFASAFCSVLKKRGFAIFSPFDNVANDVTPTSMPTAAPFVYSRISGSLCPKSTVKHANHLPVERLLI